MPVNRFVRVQSCLRCGQCSRVQSVSAASSSTFTTSDMTILLGFAFCGCRDCSHLLPLVFASHSATSSGMCESIKRLMHVLFPVFLPSSPYSLIPSSHHPIILSSSHLLIPLFPYPHPLISPSSYLPILSSPHSLISSSPRLLISSSPYPHPL